MAEAAMASRDRLAIVLFNLGAPDRPEAVAPFLRNLFRDPAILRVPFFVRPFLARLIASRRTAPATANYALLGGKSPLLEWTERQARALETAMRAAMPETDTRCFVVMRYWHPFARQVAPDIRAWKPDRMLLLPLYPQYSSTTTGSSLADWRNMANKAGIVCPVTTLCCWPTDPDFVRATAGRVRQSYDAARAELAPGIRLRVLFSAHGLPESIVKAGDPYQFQVGATVGAVVAALGIADLDWTICYQSRVTPEPWLSPSTDAEVARAAQDGVAVLVVPIAFVSEHSETLVELDVEYRHQAERLGVKGYFRVPAQNDDPVFISALAGLAQRSLARGPGLVSQSGERFCPAAHGDCPHFRAGAA